MNVSLLVFVALLIRTNAVEPICSKFPYEEALLEKMVRSEFKFEQLQAVVKATLDRVESTLKEFSDVTETKLAKMEEFMADGKDVFEEQEEKIERMSDDLRTQYTDLRRNLTGLMEASKDVFDEQEEKIGRISESLHAQLTDLHKNLTESTSIPILAFKATGIKNARPSTGEVLVFPTVMFNSGNGYDSSNGIFTAPVDGLYLFTTQMCIHSSNHIAVSIMVEETEVGRSYTHDGGSSYPCNTGDAIVEVTAGQKISVKTLGRSGNLHSSPYRLISFSGAMMSKGN